MGLRAYQQKLLESLRPNCLAIAGTGAGKSHCISAWAEHWQWLGVLIIGHTNEIIVQISNKLSMPHDVIAPNRPFIGHHVAVASIDTIIRRNIDLSRYRFAQWDKAHHLTPLNKWGRIWRAMPHAYHVGWTATPFRLDGQSLAAVFTGGIVEGPSVAELVAAGWITPLHVFGPPCAIDRAAIARDADGELNRTATLAALRKSHIVGDVAASYLRFARGLRGVTFAASVGLAEQHAAAYRAAGVPAAVVTAATRDRRHYTEALAAGDLLQLCVVGLFGEGYDLPVIEVVTMARPSESASLVWQQAGRVRRPAPGKRVGILIDHVGNIRRHGLPDYIDKWELDEGKRAGQGAASGLRTCPACLTVYNARETAVCPACGTAVESAPERTGLQAAPGELEAYTAADLERMSLEARRAVAVPKRPPQNLRERIVFRRMQERAVAQAALRQEMYNWGMRWGGGTELELTERFHAAFGKHPLEAMALGGPSANELAEKLRSWQPAG